MKKILFLLLLCFSCMISFAQQTEKKKKTHLTTGSHFKKFLDDVANQKPSILPMPLTVKEYPQQITLADSLRNGLFRKEVTSEYNLLMTNTIPVWSPGSDYVFNMPGTFAFDKNKVRIHTPRYVTIVNRKVIGASEKTVAPTK